MMDEQIFGGLLSADNAEKKLRVATKLFYHCEVIDWVECITGSTHESTLNELSYDRLKVLLWSRLIAMAHFKLAGKILA
jgi:hypothetical protein